MKKTLVLSGIAIVSLVASFVAKVPASIVWQQLRAEQLVPESIELDGIRGTVWSGSAERVRVDGRALPAAQWNFASFSVSELTAGYDIQLGTIRTNLFSRGRILLGYNSVAVQNMTARAAVDYLEPWLDIPFPIALEGQVSTVINELQITAGKCQALDGSGRLIDIKAVTQWGELDLGQGDFSLDCSIPDMTASLSQKSSQLVSSFKIRLKDTGHYSVNGRVEPQPGLSKSFRDGLGFIGERDQRGAYKVSLQGRI